MTSEDKTTEPDFWLQKELYRFFFDCTDQELEREGVTRSDVLFAARCADSDDGTGTKADVVWAAIRERANAG